MPRLYLVAQNLNVTSRLFYTLCTMFEFQSEDLRLLREEIEKGLADLRKVTLIRNECAQLDWFGSNTGRCSK